MEENIFILEKELKEEEFLQNKTFLQIFISLLKYPFLFSPFLIIILLFLSLISFFNEPFVSFPHFEYLTDANTKSKRDFCNHCLVTVNNETHKSSCSCDVCKERYCSKECKEKAWNQYHVIY